MRTKLLLVMTWVFYLISRRSGEEIWLFCLVYSALLTVCTLLYQMENGRKSSSKKKP